MKMIPITQFIEVIKKQGAIGVLALWLFYTHTEVQELKQRLYDCYGKGKGMVQEPIADTTNFAIVPKDELNEVE